ncbi:MAG: DNA repair protein RecN [Clostridiales bacterium]|jgi:DNA repair protein RecN (Recombination protein N)|nr:DNA repair protein RecN [Clostridiales bacterium]
MINSLHIENIALIKKLSVDFSEGLNVLSGETGAGKSILIDSINFILGGRADKALIRYGENAAAVEAVFDYDESDSVKQFFADNGIEIESGDNIILRRVMTAENKNECRVNGRLVSLSVLKNLTALLADIYGQNEHQSLLKPSSHIAVIDGMNREIAGLKEETKTLYTAYKAVCAELDGFGDLSYRERRIDILEFQIDEIERANIKDGEEEELKKERARLSNMGRLTSAAAAAYELLDGDEMSASYTVSEAASNFIAAGEYDETAAEIGETLSDIRSQLNDAVRDAKKFLDGLNYDERYADDVENRFDEIRLIKKKYGATPAAVKAHLEKAREEYDALKDCENVLERLNKEKERIFGEYVKTAARLSEARRKTAEKFENDIKRELAELSMAGTTFKVEFYGVQREKKDGIVPRENILNGEKKDGEKLCGNAENNAKKYGIEARKTTENNGRTDGAESRENAGNNTEKDGAEFRAYVEKNMRKDGVDSLEFLISPNAGEPLKPFSKIISGGEMSRFMLALKNLVNDGISVMIFDEIDTGISGKVAEVVAQKLSDISRGRQVLAVTHLPQLASYADKHFLISKGTVGEKTLTNLETLSDERSIEEIARLSGGSDTGLAIPHARNIKEKAEDYKRRKAEERKSVKN